MTLRQEQPDLFTTPRPKPAAPARAKPFADTSRAAHEELHDGGLAATVEARILACIRRAGAFGVTRQEIAERLGLAINVVCGRVDHLLELEQKGGRWTAPSFEPFRGGVINPQPNAKGQYPKGLYQQRDGRKIVVAWEYLAHYPDTKRHFDQRAA